MTPEQAHATAAIILMRRLVQRHGLTVEDAVTAVGQRRRRETGPHTHLATMEALAVIEEAAAPIRALMAALQPMVQAASDAMAELAHVLRSSTTAAAQRRDRPAWVSPYGPPSRRR